MRRVCNKQSRNGNLWWDMSGFPTRLNFLIHVHKHVFKVMFKLFSFNKINIPNYFLNPANLGFMPCLKMIVAIKWNKISFCGFNQLSDLKHMRENTCICKTCVYYNEKFFSFALCVWSFPIILCVWLLLICKFRVFHGVNKCG